MKNIYPYLGGHLYSIGETWSQNKKDERLVEEIRIRKEKPLLIYENKHERHMLSATGEQTQQMEKAYRPSGQDITRTMEKMSRYSLYAFEESMKKGFLTLPGGHRVGICGDIVMKGDRVQTIQNISSLHIRLGREIIGAASEIIPFIQEPLGSTLIIAPPGKGKTTILRDLIRILAHEFTVGLVDERGEISGSHHGRSAFDLGMQTDYMVGSSKAIGIDLLLRSMSPDIIAVDEIGGESDIKALKKSRHSGVRVIATIHGTSLEDINEKAPNLLEIFQVLVILGGQVGEITQISNGRGEVLMEKNGTQITKKPSIIWKQQG